MSAEQEKVPVAPCSEDHAQGSRTAAVAVLNDISNLEDTPISNIDAHTHLLFIIVVYDNDS